MAIKKVKVFETGTHNGQEFSNEDVKNIFGKAEKANAIFAHSSKWKDLGKTPLNLGEFSDFELLEEEGKTKVYAGVEFNEKGLSYKEDGTFKGISVELLEDNKLGNIALLPVGVNPAVKGAEFQVSEALEFEEREFETEGTLNILEILKTKEFSKEELDQISDVIYKKENEMWYVEKLRGAGYNVSKEFQETNEFEGMTPSEIAKKVKEDALKEFQEVQEKKDDLNKFFEENKLRITPAMKDKKIFEFAETLNSNNNEFEVNQLEMFKCIVESLPTLNVEGNNYREYQNDNKNTIETMNEKAKRIMGGK